MMLTIPLDVKADLLLETVSNAQTTSVKENRKERRHTLYAQTIYLHR